jgi:hypothetical protein
MNLERIFNTVLKEANITGNSIECVTKEEFKLFLEKEVRRHIYSFSIFYGEINDDSGIDCILIIKPGESYQTSFLFFTSEDTEYSTVWKTLDELLDVTYQGEDPIGLILKKYFNYSYLKLLKG